MPDTQGLLTRHLSRSEPTVVASFDVNQVLDYADGGRSVLGSRLRAYGDPALVLLAWLTATGPYYLLARPGRTIGGSG